MKIDDYKGLVTSLVQLSEWTNATKLGLVFNKDPADYLSNANTQKYLDICKKHTPECDCFVKIENGVTWIHPDILINYASWCSNDLQFWFNHLLANALTDAFNMKT